MVPVLVNAANVRELILLTGHRPGKVMTFGITEVVPMLLECHHQFY
jgi:hypothetical protein